jgi:hypothetical protein
VSYAKDSNNSTYWDLLTRKVVSAAAEDRVATNEKATKVIVMKAAILSMSSIVYMLFDL